ncbi:hypothetical protein [Actinomadura sp. 9N407]|uniref:hypothetical protein n=1 Tax=Actinomadura sp. 9N407 TaxID=3375154 RepID=UPI00379107F2
MPDPDAHSRPSSEPPPAGNGAVRPVLWVVLAISAAGNMVVSTSGLNIIGNILFGIVTLGCATALIVQHYRTQRP